jgi:hypothetical protein
LSFRTVHLFVIPNRSLFCHSEPFTFLSFRTVHFFVIPNRSLFCHSEPRSGEESAVPCGAPVLANHHLAPLLPFFLTLQNELTPNHANVTVKQIATATRPKPLPVEWNFAYSCARKIPPLAAITRKTRPVTSSHNWCSTRPKARAAVEAACRAARTIRLRWACCDATRATTPNFRAVETLFTASILTAFSATITPSWVRDGKLYRGLKHLSASGLFVAKAGGNRGA